MSNDTAMLSDDDRPLGVGATSKGAVTNGHSNGQNGDVAMSDDEDMPLSQLSRQSEPVNHPPRYLKRKKVVYAESSSEDDTPLASSPAKRATSTAVSSAGTGSSPANGGANSDEDDYDESPKKKPATNGKAKKPAKKKVKVEENGGASGSNDDEKPAPPKKPAARKRKVKAESDAEGSDDDKPIAKKPAPKRQSKAVKKEDANSGSDTPKPKKKTARAKKDAKKDEEADGSPTKGKGKKKAKKEEEEEEVFRWWDADINGDGTTKWRTLEHNGVIFPPPYEPLPSNVKMKYNGKVVDLPPAAEEVAGFYAALLESDHAQDKTFNENFFDDWVKVLGKHPARNGVKISDFSLCDFRPMFEHFEEEKAKKKALTAKEKKEIKQARDEMEAKYLYCMLDGRKEKIGNFRIEPPGLFRGRGQHPKKGALKHRVRPEDIVINIGKGVPIPVPNMPGKWKKVQHDQTVTWLATWTENINGNHKYVFLAAGSSLKGQSDMQKFEKARELKKHVDRIRQNYQADLKSKVMADRQRATTMYFIDKLALRAGNEKGEDEADTVGCCSLRCEHLTLEAPNFIIFDFLGKDSIRYYNRVEVEPQIFKNIRIFKDNKNDEDSLFDRVTTTSLNKHLTNEMPGLTAKVFRTYNASFTFQGLLNKADLEGASLQEKLNAYNNANRLVAILCNHQRAAPKTHDSSMEKMRHKYKGLKYERMKLRHALFGIDSKYKNIKQYAEDESDIDEDFVQLYEDELKAKEIERAEKKFARVNEKLEEEGKPKQNDDVLANQLTNIEEEFKRLEKERGKDKARPRRDQSVDKIEIAIQKLSDKIKTFKLQMVDRDAGKEVALGTSKINYLDPRITVAWCEKNDVPIEKMFSKTLKTKFPWAMEVGPEWQF